MSDVSLIHPPLNEERGPSKLSKHDRFGHDDAFIPRAHKRRVGDRRTRVTDTANRSGLSTALPMLPRRVIGLHSAPGSMHARVTTTNTPLRTAARARYSTAPAPLARSFLAPWPQRPATPADR